MKLELTLVKDLCGAARVPLKTINVAGRHKRFVGHFKPDWSHTLMELREIFDNDAAHVVKRSHSSVSRSRYCGTNINRR